MPKLTPAEAAGAELAPATAAVDELSPAPVAGAKFSLAVGARHNLSLAPAAGAKLTSADKLTPCSNGCQWQNEINCYWHR